MATRLVHTDKLLDRIALDIFTGRKAFLDTERSQLNNQTGLIFHEIDELLSP